MAEALKTNYEARGPLPHTTKTTQEAALLYRLCGGYNPLRVDEAFCQRAGFKGSIPQEPDTCSMVAHALLQTMGCSNPRRFTAYGARFKNVVYPGDIFETPTRVGQSKERVDNNVF